MAGLYVYSTTAGITHQSTYAALAISLNKYGTWCSFANRADFIQTENALLIVNKFLYILSLVLAT